MFIHFTGYLKQIGSGDITGIYRSTTRPAIKRKTVKIRFKKSSNDQMTTSYIQNSTWVKFVDLEVCVGKSAVFSPIPKSSEVNCELSSLPATSSNAELNPVLLQVISPPEGPAVSPGALLQSHVQERSAQLFLNPNSNDNRFSSHITFPHTDRSAECLGSAV